MRIVDKYGLAKCPNGTPFYLLSDAKASHYRDGKREYCIPKIYNIEEGLRIFDGNFGISNGFNGVLRVMPDVYTEDGDNLTEDNVSSIPLEFSIDDDSDGDYNDEDRFLILSSEEFKVIIDLLTNYYNKLCLNGGAEENDLHV